MTRTELNKFSAILNAKKVEATRTLGKREGLAIERTPDALDEVQFAAAKGNQASQREPVSLQIRIELQPCPGDLARSSGGPILEASARARF